MYYSTKELRTALFSLRPGESGLGVSKLFIRHAWSYCTENKSDALAEKSDTVAEKILPWYPKKGEKIYENLFDCCAWSMTLWLKNWIESWTMMWFSRNKRSTDVDTYWLTYSGVPNNRVNASKICYIASYDTLKTFPTLRCLVWCDMSVSKFHTF